MTWYRTMLFFEYLRHRAEYRLTGHAAKVLTAAYLLAPREGIQDEIGLLQRRLTIRAHTIRKRAEARADALRKDMGI